ncbi:hypothetical protein RvY_07031 [Ramazzottius varieornatus]|uniref:Uncharacterized protein n=1 Tax=Ramazzottius varieornatus TaxID=947166 RepID=A0A1D1VA45_RAMVA|nr:hypothetical protein RvY_07031 [Ramazzottius varieornatus]
MTLIPACGDAIHAKAFSDRTQQMVQGLHNTKVLGVETRLDQPARHVPRKHGEGNLVQEKAAQASLSHWPVYPALSAFGISSHSWLPVASCNYRIGAAISQGRAPAPSPHSGGPEFSVVQLDFDSTIVNCIVRHLYSVLATFVQSPVMSCQKGAPLTHGLPKPQAADYGENDENVISKE